MGGFIDDVEIRGKLQANDGPCTAQLSGTIQNVKVESRVSDNLKNAGNYGETLSTPRGLFHSETGQTNHFIISGCTFKGQGADADALISDRDTANYNDWRCITGEPTGLKMDVANGRLFIYDRESFTGTVDNADGFGFGLDPFSSGAVGVQNFNRASEMYLGWSNSEPSVAESNAAYFDDGSNTGDSNPGWRYTTDGGTNWNDLN